jgi:hypothetical protein
MKPWQIMVMFAIVLGLLVATLQEIFPHAGTLFVIAGAVGVVLIGMKVLPQGDSNEKEN